MCLGCSHAPEYQSGDSRVVFYCSRECQMGDWPNHKDFCKNMQKRKILLRAAQILKAAMLAYRETVYDVDLTKIEYRDGVLYLHQNQRPVSSQSKRGPFPNHMTDNIEHKEAALVKSQSTAAMALLGPLTRKLLRGKRPLIYVRTEASRG
ncbi:Zinc finger, MYND-type [Penicillium expansum]|uniref:Zinc finger, MYND-type n=1 Tax=Penicillium expansum TaxID=27334 RepID=A0A0A2KPR2_PENEN|nr:Zinc finger, MYND-type [Penicillium expansum]KGO44271.1 Zinc finger, MYND-type [Penicillium expansum]KGO60097.1 Zinc finger, MYND-type [Penicillium expansum]KGO68886.1 Zinc finger, MYND-type [Penicillium expansum]